jgi:UDP-2-acetamido-3-amino-2,3-dideoxy-glucuronate N-acetyltransferase
MTPNSSPLTPDSSPLTPHIAVIGAGYWGKNLVRNFHQLGVLKTICDGAQPIREEMSKTYSGTDYKSVPLITANVSDVLKDTDITGVVIAAPAALHYEKDDLI